MLGRLDDPGVLPDEALITPIALAELTFGPLVGKEEQGLAPRQAQQQH